MSVPFRGSTRILYCEFRGLNTRGLVGFGVDLLLSPEKGGNKGILRTNHLKVLGSRFRAKVQEVEPRESSFEPRGRREHAKDIRP